jgi:2-polyprenyl-3-methyl-5-hydroxy-6-metoxy-1,4-benzoquinol methylase
VWRDARKRYAEVAREMRSLFSQEDRPPMLEVGFGDGRFLREFRHAGFNVHGFDISPTAVERLNKEEIPATYAPSLAEAEFPTASIDFVSTWEVFEHIPNPVSFSREIHRILRPGGYWLIQVPNWRWLNLKMRIVSKLPGEKRYLSIYGVLLTLFHLYHYTHESLKRTLEPQGFRHQASYRIRLDSENHWQALVTHELLFLLDSIPAFLSGNRKHWNVILVELYQAG